MISDLISREKIKHLEWDFNKNKSINSKDLEEKVLVYARGHSIFIKDNGKEYLVKSRMSNDDNNSFGTRLNRGIINLLSYGGTLYDFNLMENRWSEENDEFEEKFVEIYITLKDKLISFEESNYLTYYVISNFLKNVNNQTLECYHSRKYFVEAEILEERKLF